MNGATGAAGADCKGAGGITNIVFARSISLCSVGGEAWLVDMACHGYGLSDDESPSLRPPQLPPPPHAWLVLEGSELLGGRRELGGLE